MTYNTIDTTSNPRDLSIPVPFSLVCSPYDIVKTMTTSTPRPLQSMKQNKRNAHTHTQTTPWAPFFPGGGFSVHTCVRYIIYIIITCTIDHTLLDSPLYICCTIVHAVCSILKNWTQGLKICRNQYTCFSSPLTGSFNPLWAVPVAPTEPKQLHHEGK